MYQGFVVEGSQMKIYHKNCLFKRKNIIPERPVIQHFLKNLMYPLTVDFQQLWTFDYQVHRGRDQRFRAGRDRAREERVAAVERHLGSFRKREDKSERQLLQVRKVHGHQL